MTETHPTYITDRDKETLFKFASLFGADIADEIMKACLNVEYGSVTINAENENEVVIYG